MSLPSIPVGQMIPAPLNSAARRANSMPGFEPIRAAVLWSLSATTTTAPLGRSRCNAGVKLPASNATTTRANLIDWAMARPVAKPSQTAANFRESEAAKYLRGVAPDTFDIAVRPELFQGLREVFHHRISMRR